MLLNVSDCVLCEVGHYHLKVTELQRKGRGESHPGTGHEGPEVEQSCSYTLSLISALDEGGWSTPRPGCFNLRKDPVPFVWEAEWATVPVWKCAQNLATSTGIRSADRPDHRE